MQCLITEKGNLGPNKYLDPRTGQSFSFDHLRKSATDVEAADVDDCDGFRSAFEEAVTQYTKDHYMKGVRCNCIATLHHCPIAPLCQLQHCYSAALCPGPARAWGSHAARRCGGRLLLASSNPVQAC